MVLGPEKEMGLGQVSLEKGEFPEEHGNDLQTCEQGSASFWKAAGWGRKSPGFGSE